MGTSLVRKGRREDMDDLRFLITSLARFEKLEPPDREAIKRISKDIFDNQRLGFFIATVGRRKVGYALYYYSYSSFLGRPTLFLEDVFVLEEFRGLGIGESLFQRCAKEAVLKGCGRMEWIVLTWNRNAIAFYEKKGAKRMSDWYTYRLDSAQLRALVKIARPRA